MVSRLGRKQKKIVIPPSSVNLENALVREVYGCNHRFSS